MAISDGKANFGLSATGTGNRAWITGTSVIGQTASIMTLTGCDIAFAALLTLPVSGDTASLDLNDFATTDGPVAVAATGTLTLSGNAVAGETVTIGTQVYTWRATVGATANEVKIGATASDSIDNLCAATTTGAGSGTLYGSATADNTSAAATAGSGDTATITALTAGVAGNSIATTDTMTAGSFGAATLTGGRDAAVWTGASLDFQGEAYAEPVIIQGILVQCDSGAVVMETASTELVVPLQEGHKFQIASAVGGIPLDILNFTGDDTGTSIYIAVLAKAP